MLKIRLYLCLAVDLWVVSSFFYFNGLLDFVEEVLVFWDLIQGGLASSLIINDLFQFLRLQKRCLCMAWLTTTRQLSSGDGNTVRTWRKIGTFPLLEAFACLRGITFRGCFLSAFAT